MSDLWAFVVVSVGPVAVLAGAVVTVTLVVFSWLAAVVNVVEEVG